MQLPTTIYVLTPTLGMAVATPDFQQVDTREDKVAFRITAKVYPVRREKPGDEWKAIPVAR